jgi:phytoene synthase
MDPAAEAERVLRERDRERWLANLFAPAAVRADLNALYAFSGEIARARDVVREPMIGEIRLQWWRDVLSGGDAAGHPVAAALLAAVRRHDLPLQPLENLVGAHVFDLYDDPMPALADFEGYAGETASILVQLSAMILTGKADPGTADAAGHAGVALSIASHLQGLPFEAARGQVFIPGDVLARHGASSDDIRQRRNVSGVKAAVAEMTEHAGHHLDRARAALAGVDPAALPAFLPLALVPGRLAAAARAENPLAEVRRLPGWRAQLRLWTAARRAGRGRTFF